MDTDPGPDAVLGTWQTESVAGEAPPQGVSSKVTFTDERRVEGHGGVNTFGGSFELSGGEIEFSALFSTLMAGPEPASRHEAQLLGLLTGRRPFTIDGDTLVIGSGDDEVRFHRAGGRAEGAPADEPATVDVGDVLEVSGSVLYRQRIALPPGAVVTVYLRDVSIADVPSPTIAAQTIPVEHQVPIPFSLTVERSALEERNRYSLSAQITVDGELRWTSETHIPVAADGPTTGIDIMVVPVG